jgi:hypothetical protein
MHSTADTLRAFKKERLRITIEAFTKLGSVIIF